MFEILWTLTIITINHSTIIYTDVMPALSPNTVKQIGNINQCMVLVQENTIANWDNISSK